jgi:O-antigen/teichoic acid export membrane protein
VISDLVSLIVLVIGMRHSVRLRPRVDTTAWRRWVKEAAPLAIGSALGTLYFKLDSIMLTLLLHGRTARVAIGTYQVGYKFSDLLAFVGPALIASTLPLLSRAWPAQPDEYRRLFRQSLVLVVVIGGLATAAFAALAGHVIPLLFTESYASAAGPARWLVAGQSLNFATQLCYVGLVAAARTRVYPWITLTGLFVNVGLNVALIPAHHEMGAAVATVLTEVVVLSLLASALRGLPIRPLPVRTFAVAGGGAVAAAVTILVLSALVAWPVGAVAGVAVYVGVLHWGRVDGTGGLRALLENSRISPTHP